MKSIDKFVLVLVASLALLLAGCGGGSSTTTTDPDPEPPAPMPDYVSMAKDYRLAAADAEDDLDDAVDMAKMAVNGADGDADGKGGSDGYTMMLTALATKGESMSARDNAQKILDAADDVDAAVMSAKMALMDAKTALTNAMALPDGTEGKAQAVTDLEEAIEALEMEIMIDDEGMHMLVEDGQLDMYSKAVKTDVESVTNQNGFAAGDDKGMGTPADSASAVAKATLELFERADGSGLATPLTAAPTGVTGMFAMGDTAKSSMMTYDMIFETQDIGLGNDIVQGIALSGKSNTDGTNTISAAGTNLDDGSANAFSYMGIPGNAVCRKAGGCTVDTTAEKLGDGWYFVPTNNDTTRTPAVNWQTALLSKSNGSYDLATYAKYGVWLTGDEAADPSTLAVNRYSMGMGDPAPTTALADTLEGSATYSGTARGLSARYNYNQATGAKSGHQSGEFMADLMLTLEFGDDNNAAMLSGVVKNFSGVNNPGVVDASWEVTLEEHATPLTAFTDGTTMSKGATASTTAGAWTANPFGSHVYDDMDTEDTADDVSIAMGYHGAFDANFSNGEVAGVYAAEVDE